jgi:hypothetical protein
MSRSDTDERVRSAERVSCDHCGDGDGIVYLICIAHMGVDLNYGSVRGGVVCIQYRTVQMGSGLLIG